MTAQTALAAYALALGDDALVLAQRCAEWVTRAPQLEEDVALANIGLDLLGQARALLAYAGQVEGQGRTEDDLAYLRAAGDFRNLLLLEQPNGDFAFSMGRLLVWSTYASELYDRLRTSRDAHLAAVAAKALKEVAYHRDHAASWVVRLGDGTEASHRRMRTALQDVWPFVDEVFDASWLDTHLLRSGVAVDPTTLRPGWQRSVSDVLSEGTLEVPTGAEPVSGGRSGRHTAALAELLEDMQAVHRAHPGARW